MRTFWKISALSLATVAAGCGREKQKTATLPDDLQKDLAAASAGGEFATAPTSYQRMRFVSAIEQSKPAVPAKRPAMTRQHIRAAISHRQTNPLPAAAELEQPAVAEATSPVTTREAPAPEPAISVAPVPAPTPSSAPAGSSANGDGGQGGGGGGGIGEVLGGIFGAVIRGGHVGVDKCDPRTDGRGGATVMGPIFGSPVPTGQPTFPGGVRRR
jgi:hypothetical protein